MSESLGLGQLSLLVTFLTIALGFEFVNGFHDAANAIATVIYTKSLTPRKAVVWSGICNFIGVHLGGTAVAFSIVHLLPVDLLVSIGSKPGMAMVLALLISAILWNLGTWFLGLPASSSHTLIGAILGVGLANALMEHHDWKTGINWHQTLDVAISLLVSPMIGFCLAGLSIILLRKLVRTPELYEPPTEGSSPPAWVRAVLLTTCTGVSVAHGSNDGQKGVGLIMLILIGLMPARFAIDPNYSANDSNRAFQVAGELETLIEQRRPTQDNLDPEHLARLLVDLRQTLSWTDHPASLGSRERWRVRTDLLRIDADLGKLANKLDHDDPAGKLIARCRAELRKATDYAPTWVTIAVASALGIGTMVGWKRIVVTVGEKIGKTHLTYAQGASAEVVAMATIGMADLWGMPVSTTHVLSSGVAGTMAAERHGLQYQTVRAILLAWVLTLPATMALSGGLFVVFRMLA